MKGLSLKEHIKRSKQAVTANKAKGNRHAELLSGMYSKPARFIDEILQNTEDAYARRKTFTTHKSIKFELFPDRIEIRHNGKDFDEEDLKSITTFANTTKNRAEEVNLIGKFGIGFKSVFAITDEPEIHSGDYHYKITDYEVLEKTAKQNPETQYSTLFVMPFKESERNKIYNIVRQGLNELNAYYLLFLTHVNKIEIKLDTKKTSDYIEKEVIKVEDEIQKVLIKSSVQSREDEKFLLLKKEKQNIEIAFKIKTSRGKETVEPIPNSKLFVYFSTLQETHLDFLINAAFTTTPTRESVPFDKFKANENIILINEIADFFGSKLTRLRDIGFLNADFPNILPIRKITTDTVSENENLVYKVFYDVVLKKLSEKKLIPTESGKFEYANELALATDSEICELLQKNDLKALFARKEWVSLKLNDEGFDDLRKYLSSQLNILEVGFEKFAFHLSLKPDFLKQKNDKWFIQFYSILHNKRYLWSKENQSQYYNLRSKAFIKLNDNSISEGFDKNGNSIVYLPGSQRSKYKILKRTIAKNQQVLEFLKDFGLTEPDELAEVLENLSKYNSETLEIHSKTYKTDLKKLLKVYKDSSVSDRNKLLSALKDCYLFEAYNPVLNETKFCLPNEIVLIEKGEEQSNNYYLSSRLLKLFRNEINENKLFEQLLQDLGVKYAENQSFVESESDLSEEQKTILNFIEKQNISLSKLQQIFNQNSTNKIEIKPEEVNVKIRDFEVSEIEIQSNVLSNIPISDLSALAFPALNSQRDNNLQKWSEDLVFKWISENESGNNATIQKVEINEQGYSFEIRNNNTSKFIAVIAKQIFEDEFQISKTIWKSAEKFAISRSATISRAPINNQSSPSRTPTNYSFWFYCIPNAGLSCTEIIRIQNPFNLWQEGKLSFNKLSFRF
ncbi:MAG: hypothetical protein K9J13_08515 [Saprospiraceae bacterium]|nr:hypothetical protein [Saprospiraceae bacterium]